MSKYVAKFRKDRDYDDDYGNFSRKKKNKSHDPSKKLANYQYDNYLTGYDDEEYQKGSRRKVRHY